MLLKINSIISIYSVLTTTFTVFVQGYLDNTQIDEIPFEIVLPLKRIPDRESIIAHLKLEERRNFFQLFNVHYLLCFYAAKGKWPFIPPGMQAQVDEVGRSFFTHNDLFIRAFCKKWFPIQECHRPNITPPPKSVTTPTPIITEVETFTPEPETEEPTTVCTCSSYKRQKPRPRPQPNNEVFYFDKNEIGNASSETIQNTIEFLQGFLPASTGSSSNNKKNKKTKIRINVSPREDFSLT